MALRKEKQVVKDSITTLNDKVAAINLQTQQIQQVTSNLYCVSHVVIWLF